MKTAILSRNKNLYSTRRLIEACEQRGHEPMVLDVLRSYMEVVPSKPEAHIKGVTLEAFDAAIQSQCREDESAPASIFALINTSPGVTCSFSTQPITF